MSNAKDRSTTSDKSVKADRSAADKRLKLIVDIALTAIFIGIIVYLTFKLGPRLTELAKEPERLKELLNSYGWRGILVFIALQIIQVVVAAIPGEFVQIAGGYIYGPWLGTLYSLVGIVLGSVIVFYIARFLGYRIVKLVVRQEQLDKLSFMINSNKSEIGMFILFLIPGIPKDILTYIAGITPVKASGFFAVITLGRLPALFGSAYIGSSMQQGNYTVAIAIFAAAVVLFVVGLLLKEKIIVKIRKLI